MLQDGSHYQYGIQRRCIMNELSNFHVLTNIIVDVMHDLMLGVLKYDIKALLNFYTQGGLLNLDDLNLRIKNWNFGVKETIRINKLKKEHFNTGSVHMNAKEVWFFVENLPLLLNGLVPQNNEHYKFLLFVHDLQDICLQPEYGPVEFYLLDFCIKTHHRLYMYLFRHTLTPKYHFLLHYAEVIKRCGPLKDLMCYRPESKHQEVKSYTNVSHNRRNIQVSIANKQQLRFSDTILNFNAVCLTDFVTSIKKTNQSMFDEIVLNALKCFLEQNNKSFENLNCAEKITFKGTIFSKNEYLIKDEDSACLIEGIVITSSNAIIMYRNIPIFYEENLRAYGLIEENNDQMILYDFIENFKYIPVTKNSSMGINYIKKLRRY